MKSPLVSVIIPTKNSAATLTQCLESVRDQSYANIEIIVVDNSSTDNTQVIAKEFTDKVFSKGPERSAQVNYGVSQASGKYVYKIDSDFILDPTVVEECVDLCVNKGMDAVVVHNSPDVRVSWIARVRKFEVDMYKYNINHSSARFLRKDLYDKIGGFDSRVTAGEDYDFQNKLNRANAKIGFADAEALHLGEPKKLLPHLKKYYMYGKDFINYKNVSTKKEQSTQIGFFRSVYFKEWRRFFRHPFAGIRFGFYNILKYAFGGAGLLIGMIEEKRKK